MREKLEIRRLLEREIKGRRKINRLELVRIKRNKLRH